MSEKYDLSNREIATILCALRKYQEKFDWDTVRILPWFEETTPLNIEEINTLCQKLNIGKSTVKITVAGDVNLNVFETIAGYVKILQKAEPGIEIDIKGGI